jgi:ABC-type spermidine/putrescine transport system permease subunit I
VYPRWIWRAFALPGVGWLIAFFVVAFYAIVATSFGFTDDVGDPIPVWNPLNWNVGWFNAVFQELEPGGIYWTVFLRTFVYVIAAASLSLLIGYPVAYYVARRAGRWRGPLLLLIVLPFWISYLMRMFAWINLLADDGYATRLLAFFQIDTLFRQIGLLDQGAGWLDGQAISVIMALVYGYVPFMILPVYAAADRIDQRVIEAARDLGGSPASAFRRVTLPLSMPGILGGLVLITLPMFGDYYTADLISSSPRTNMIGNQIDLAIHRGSEKPIGAALTVVLSLMLVVLMAYYLRHTHRAGKAARMGAA